MRRLEKAQGLCSVRDSRAERKARTRHLIELGGLVVKAGLVELTDDDRAVILGGCLDIAGRLRGANQRDERPAGLMTLWRRRGLNAFAEGASRAKQTGGDS
jgi:hypothetical protein